MPLPQSIEKDIILFTAQQISLKSNITSPALAPITIQSSVKDLLLHCPHHHQEIMQRCNDPNTGKEGRIAIDDVVQIIINLENVAYFLASY